MLIIWGTKGMEKILGYTAQRYQCEHCNNVGQYKVFRRQRWFTLFWIPLFPIRSEYFVCCPICNYGQKVPKEEAKRLISEGVTV